MQPLDSISRTPDFKMQEERRSQSQHTIGVGAMIASIVTRFRPENISANKCFTSERRSKSKWHWVGNLQADC
jgi:hypothetical protein